MRPKLGSCVLMVAMCLAADAQNRTADGDTTMRILALENAWNEAELKHDAQALSLLLGETFAFTDSDGSFMNKGQWLSHVKGKVDQYDQLGNSEMKAHVYGDAAIVVGKYREKIKVGGKVILRTGRFTDTWIQQNGEWKCVASQSTLISP